MKKVLILHGEYVGWTGYKQPPLPEGFSLVRVLCPDGVFLEIVKDTDLVDCTGEIDAAVKELPRKALLAACEEYRKGGE